MPRFSNDMTVTGLTFEAFFVDGHATEGANRLRFTACKTDEEIARVKERLRGLKAFVA